MRIVASCGALVVAIGCIALSGSGKRSRPEFESVSAQPVSWGQLDPDVLQIISMGYNTALSSVYWVQAIFAFADATFEKKGMTETVWLVRTVIGLDRQWDYPVEFAGLVFDGTNGTSAAEGISVLQDGIRQHPRSWRLRLYLAMLLRRQNAPIDSIGNVLTPLLSDSIMAPQYVRGLAVTLLDRGGKRRDAMRILTGSYTHTEDPLLRAFFRTKMDAMLDSSGISLGGGQREFVDAVLDALSNRSESAGRLERILCDLVDPSKSEGVLRDAVAIAEQWREFSLAQKNPMPSTTTPESESSRSP